MSAVDRRYINNNDEVLGVQRPLKYEKVRAIKKYLTTRNATFPNSIIVNVKRDDVICEENDILELKVNDETFTIIDGQHRLFGFEEYTGNQFELILTIFIGLDSELQAEVFSIINTQQTKVDPSLNINLELADKTDNPRKVIVQIAQSLNYDKDSPWYDNIKLLGSQSEGIISLSSFVKPIFNLTYPEKEFYTIKNMLKDAYPEFPSLSLLDVDTDRYPLWLFYKEHNKSVIYKILLNYFNAIKTIFPTDWLSQESLLNKTSGYNAIMKLFGDVVKVGISKGTLSEDFFRKTLTPISELAGQITADNYGSSGLFSSNNIYKDMCYILKTKNDN